MKEFRTFLAACLIWALCGEFSLAGDTGLVSRLIHDAKRGETALIPAGRYDVSDLAVRKSVTVRGDGDVTFFSSRPVAKGLLTPAPGVSLRVENITFEGARSPDLNGAGIRHEGLDLLIVDCRFIGNENGVLATGSSFGDIKVHNSDFVGNGHGDGYSHGIYVSSGRSLEVTDSRFIGTKVGHHVKSLAARTRVAGSRFDDADGRSSYAVDLSKGGDVTITGNRFVKSVDADNETIINYDLSRGGKAESLVITGNQLVNRHRRGKLLRNPTGLDPVISGNVTDESAINEKAPSAAKLLPGAFEPEAMPLELPPLPAPLTIEERPLAGGARAGVLSAPGIATPPGALAGFRIVNSGETASFGDYLTFGQAFAPGALQPGAAVTAQFGETSTYAQVDVKALHDDGSARHAVVTVKAPPLRKGASVDGALIVAQAPVPPDFDPAAIVSDHYAFPVRISFPSELGFADYADDARVLALAALKSGAADFWLSGPLVKELRIEKAAAPHLLLRHDIRIYRDGDIRTSVVFSNEKTFSPGRRDLSYDVAIGPVGRPVYFADAVVHHRSSVWRKAFWTGQAPTLHLLRDIDVLIESGALLPLDRSQGASARAIAELADKLTDDGPLSPALVFKYFPTTGGRGDIGPYPQWTALHLIAQTPQSEAVMLANAEAAGAVPWHFVDEATRAPVRIERRKKFWADSRGLEEQYAPDRPHADIFESSDGGWRPDHAHKPALTYVPYLLTGDRFYADELAMQAAFAIFGRWPALREGGLKAIDVEQARASAWSLRDISDAAFILPDDHPSKRYLKRAEAENLKAMRGKYVERRVMRDAGESEGYIEELSNREPEHISPWQQDYMAISLALAARRGNGDARALLDWMANFHAGRFLSPDFDPRRATSYLFSVKDKTSGKTLSSWADIANASFGGASASRPKEIEGYPTMASGYIGSAYAALIAIASETGSLEAIEALGVLARESNGLPLWSANESGGVAANPQFLLTLTKKDGTRLTRADFSGKSPAPVLFGDDGRDALSGDGMNVISFGFGGDDVLSGSDGPDDLFGGHGDDILDGGDGADRLVGGPGSDRLTGGPGPDVFAFHGGRTGGDEITDFNPAEDRLVVKRAAGAASDDVNALIQLTPEGVKLDLGGGEYVILTGVNLGALGSGESALIDNP